MTLDDMNAVADKWIANASTTPGYLPPHRTIQDAGTSVVLEWWRGDKYATVFFDCDDGSATAILSTKGESEMPEFDAFESMATTRIFGEWLVSSCAA